MSSAKPPETDVEVLAPNDDQPSPTMFGVRLVHGRYFTPAELKLFNSLSFDERQKFWDTVYGTDDGSLTRGKTAPLQDTGDEPHPEEPRNEVVQVDGLLLKHPRQLVAVSAEQSESVCKYLKAAIYELLIRKEENRYYIGKMLYVLQRERAKPGHGTFIKDVSELCIKVWTAYRYISFFKKVVDGFDPTPPRLLQSAKDDGWRELVEDAPNEAEEVYVAALMLEADEEVARIEAAARRTKDAVDQAKKDKGPTKRLRVWLYLTQAQRKPFRDAWKQLGDKRASALVNREVLRAANRPRKRTVPKRQTSR